VARHEQGSCRGPPENAKQVQNHSLTIINGLKEYKLATHVVGMESKLGIHTKKKKTLLRDGESKRLYEKHLATG